MALLKSAFIILLLSSSVLLYKPPIDTANIKSAPTPSGIANHPAHPFPQHISYRPGTILPDHISRERMDDSVRSFYAYWKNRYIRNGCHPNEYYVWFEGENSRKQCVSEGQGYGMIITALMAGHDTAAHTVFDCLFRYCRHHPSHRNPDLMAWAQQQQCRDVDGSSATDGDMDIAYALLLADAQWGSKGQINYLEEGRHTIDAIMQGEINPSTYSILLSNSVENDSKDYADMRSSDFMPAHFRLFGNISRDPRWNKVIDNNYGLFRYLQHTYSPEAGLLPDFIRKVTLSPGAGPSPNPVTGGSSTPPSTPSSTPVKSYRLHGIPAGPHYLESRYDGYYNFNACRIPWRIGTDYLLNGDPRAAAILSRINRWIRTTTGGNPDNISAGYSLTGEDLSHRYFEAMCFIAPFAIGAMSSAENQLWLNKLWDYIGHFHPRDFDYYDNSIRMIALLILSGNYWTP